MKKKVSNELILLIETLKAGEDVLFAIYDTLLELDREEDADWVNRFRVVSEYQNNEDLHNYKGGRKDYYWPQFKPRTGEEVPDYNYISHIYIGDITWYGLRGNVDHTYKSSIQEIATYVEQRLLKDEDV